MDGEKIAQILETAAVVILIVAAAVIVLGTVAIPIVLAFKYAWQWLFIYPVLLVLFIIFAPKVNSGK
jgi:hypothetical protein